MKVSMTLQTTVDPTILGYLGRALSLEMSAVQLYTAQARLLDTWGLTEPAERLRAEAHEEMAHVERVIARMLAHGAAPAASQLRPVKMGRDLAELLRHDLAFELDLVRLYGDATRYSARAGRHDDRLFFEKLLEEEQAHARELAQWIEQLGTPPADRPTAGAVF